MPPPITTVATLTAQTASWLMAVAIVMSMGTVTVRYRARQVVPAGRVMDVGLAALVGALLLARAVHVMLHWSYFSIHPAEIGQFRAGGLDWHGAVIGGWLGLWSMARYRALKLPLLLDAVALVVPLLAFAAWWGCGANHCAYGSEVQTLADYPGWLVWEERDLTNSIAPRYAVQPLGMLAAACIGLGVVIAYRRGWGIATPGRRLGAVLVALGLSGFALGFLRGDYAVMVGGLRADQWLDLGVVAFGVWITIRPYE
jgi:prolipoprotein diacylglyceryltransferase